MSRSNRTNQATFATDGSVQTVDFPSVAGIDDLAREPTDVEIRWGITRDELHRRHMSSPGVRTSRERRCRECRHRVTSMPNGQEAGHARGRKNDRCSEYPEEFAAGDPDTDGTQLMRWSK